MLLNKPSVRVQASEVFKMQTRIEEELHRLVHGLPEKLPEGLGTVRFIVLTKRDLDALIRKSKTVLEIVDRQALGDDWPTPERWPSLLPRWFIDACAHEMTPAEAQRWLARWEKLDEEQRRAEEKGKAWALADWLYWMEPGRRSWWWWDSHVNDRCEVDVQVDEWPFPWGSLSWLLRAAGASEVMPEE